MAKYAVQTRWSWPNGLPSAESMQEHQRGYKSKTKALDVIWWKIDDNTHQSLLIYASEVDAQEERVKLLERRKEDTVRNANEMIEETMGPIISIMSET